MTSQRLRLKTRIFALIVILANVFGNFFLSLGLRQRGTAWAASPWAWVQVLANPWVSLGICVLLVWMLSRLALLSWADLSWVAPVTASGYALAALLGRLFLGEQISVKRWTGILLITLGVLLVRTTAIRTTRRRRSKEAA